MSYPHVHDRQCHEAVSQEQTAVVQQAVHVFAMFGAHARDDESTQWQLDVLDGEMSVPTEAERLVLRRPFGALG